MDPENLMEGDIPPLTIGSVQRFVSGERGTGNVQILSWTTAGNRGSGRPRVRIVLSDGEVSYPTVLLADQIVQQFMNGDEFELPFFSIVEILETVSLLVRDRRVLIVLSLNLLHSGTTLQQIGNPVQLLAPEEPPPPSPPPQPQPLQLLPRSPLNLGPQQPPLPPTTLPFKQPNPPHKRRRRNSVPNYGVSHEKTAKLSSLKELTPDVFSWAIKVRCCLKSRISRFRQGVKEGSVASVNVMDREGTEMKINLWNDAIDAHFKTFEVGGVFTISNGTVVPVNRDAPETGGFMLTISPFSVVTQTPEDPSIKPKSYKFSGISSIERVDVGTRVHVVGVVIKVEDLVEIRRMGGTTAGRTVVIGDKSRCSIGLRIFGDLGFDLSVGRVLVANFVQVLQHGNCKILHAEFASSIDDGSHLRIGKELNRWFFEKEKARVRFDNLTNKMVPKTIRYIQEESMKRFSENGGRSLFYDLRATTILFDPRAVYQACQTCKAKVISESAGESYVCHRCHWGRTQVVPEARYCLSALLGDYTTSMWSKMFGDVGQTVLNYPASSLALLEEQENRDGVEEVMQDGLLRTWKFRVRVRPHTYMDEIRVQMNIIEVERVDFVQETSRLINDILRYDD